MRACIRAYRFYFAFDVRHDIAHVAAEEEAVAAVALPQDIAVRGQRSVVGKRDRIDRDRAVRHRHDGVQLRSFGADNGRVFQERVRRGIRAVRDEVSQLLLGSVVSDISDIRKPHGETALTYSLAQCDKLRIIGDILALRLFISLSFGGGFRFRFILIPARFRERVFRILPIRLLYCLVAARKLSQRQQQRKRGGCFFMLHVFTFFAPSHSP